MENFLLGYEYTGLFFLSFAAATLIPLGSEAAVAFMAAAGFNIPGVFFSATLGNSLGAGVNYAIGRWGGNWVVSRWVRPDEKKLKAFRNTYGRWGAPVSFFAWTPVIGDPLTVAAGLLHVHPLAFAFWVTLGKGLRYWLVLEGAMWISG